MTTTTTTTAEEETAAKKEAEAMAAILVDTFRNLHQRLMVVEEKISKLEEDNNENQKEK